MKLWNGLSDHKKGILCIISAGFGFSFMTFFVRISGDIPTMQKAFFRNFVALIIAVFTILKSGEGFGVKKSNIGDIAMRCLFGTSGLIANFYAIDRLGLADSNMLNKLSPFWAIIGSVFILKEKPTKRDIFATVIAFTGALFIIRPGGSNLQFFPAVIGFLGGVGAGMAYVFVRKLKKKGERTPMIVLFFSLVSCLATLPFMLFNYSHMAPWQIVCLIMAGVSAALGQFSITSAYKFAPAKELSVYDYVQVIFAALWGMIFLGEVPVLLSIIGYVIIIGVALYRWYRRHDG
ncbi:MAG TPA: EamA family transporter [Lachnospiraceae bacterium]|nr:EamA family transporter [Lachnospiraceae bacterium]